MGTAKNPAGRELTLDSRSLRRDGQPWVPAMGEFHFTRYPAAEWREELLKMKAGGIDIVATYVFWIHHEEVQGQWDWSGQRDLRRFIEAVRDAGLEVVVRCGPWCHGEARNGGLPEWVVSRKDWRVRSTDPKFLDAVRPLYTQIAQQVRGLLWKDGGPVIGVQVDNEYGGPAAYLLALKGLARDAGLDVPLYTRTGWPALSTPMPLGEIAPLYGVYAEGFWDREITSMPGRYWSGFHFSTLRDDANIANEILGRRDAKDTADVAKYPYLTCEIGGGMMNSYHRRILVDPRDIEATTLIKVAAGSTLPGYYMYHGGTNPEGKLTTLMEAQATQLTNWNDMPVKNYDFQAPLGEFGEIRPHYHTQRRLHLFLRDFGPELAGMATALPDKRPTGRDDVTTLRWAARSDGRRGFIFVSNYERSRELPPKADMFFSLTLADKKVLTFKQPVTVPAGAIFHWPFNLDLGNGMQVEWATAQPICHVDDGGVRTFFFGATPGVPATFDFGQEPGGEVAFLGSGAMALGQSGNWRLGPYTPEPGRGLAFRLRGTGGKTVQIVVLSAADSLALWKGTWQGRERAILSRAGVVFDGAALRVTAIEPGAAGVAVFPAPTEIRLGDAMVAGETDGVFRRYALPTVAQIVTPVAFEQERAAGPAREIKPGPIKQPVAQMPDEADFAAAAVWRVKLPADVDLARDPRVRFHYRGDVSRVLLGDRFITDDFYNGNARDFGLRRHAPASLQGGLRFAVLPLRADAPIFLAASARPDFGGAPSVATLERVELIQSATATLTTR